MIIERTVSENSWRLDEGLYRILLPLPVGKVPFVNVYLISSQGQYLLVDCGINLAPSLHALGRALKAIGVPPRGLTTLVATHRHSDHAGAAEPVQQHWGGRVLLHAEALRQRYPEPEESLQWLATNGVDPGLRSQIVALGRRFPEILPESVEPLPADTPLRVGDISLDVIHVPGHAAGHVMLHQPQRGWLLTADHVLPSPGANVWVNPGNTGDPLGEYLRSLESASVVPSSLILPAHGAPAESGLADWANGLATFHLNLVSQVRRLLGIQRLQAWEIVRLMQPRIIDDPMEARSLVGVVLAVLVYLQRRGEATESADGRWQA